MCTRQISLAIVCSHAIEEYPAMPAASMATTVLRHGVAPNCDEFRCERHIARATCPHPLQ